MTLDVETEEYPCLVRATNGKKVNLSTHVSHSISYTQDIDRVTIQYLLVRT